MKKTIWIINEYAGSKYHGMEFRHYYLGKELTKRGYIVYIITASFSHLFRRLPIIYGNFTFENIDGINYIWVKVPCYKHSHDKKRVFKWFIFTTKLFFLPVTKMEKPNIIIVSPMAPFPILGGYRYAKKYNAKLIYEVKDIWPLTLIELGRYSPNHPFIKIMVHFEKFAYKKSDYVVSVLPKAIEHMIKQGLDPKKFVYIPNGISLDDVKNIEPLDEKIKRLIPKEKFIVGYVGTIGIANALEYLVEAANILKDVQNIHFVLVGNGQEKERLIKMAKFNRLNNITFINPVPKWQIQSILQLFDICYISLKNCPLFRYGVSPNKLFDYMYSGKPILYAINSGNKPVEEANCGISVEAENPKAIANGILKLYNMPIDKRRKLGENGKKYVLQYHTYDRITDEFEVIFEKSSLI